MHLPNIPTDNFYKFFSISGVVLTISSFYFFVALVYKRAPDIDKYRVEIGFWSNFTIITALLGLFMSFIGFTQWYFKVQRPADIELKAKSKLAKLQYDREKKAYQKDKNN